MEFHAPLAPWRYSIPLCIIGLVSIVGSLSTIAYSENTLFGGLWAKPDSIFEEEEQTGLPRAFRVHSLINQVIQKTRVGDEPGRVRIIPDCFRRLPTTCPFGSTRSESQPPA
ncbi:MAG: hypothetical protein JXN61_00235 [Sedimentisphaerales bacterium]|nr:hypothetical protein [Sedimentisphaerales bacterium]